MLRNNISHKVIAESYQVFIRKYFELLSIEKKNLQRWKGQAQKGSGRSLKYPVECQKKSKGEVSETRRKLNQDMID